MARKTHRRENPSNATATTSGRPFGTRGNRVRVNFGVNRDLFGDDDSVEEKKQEVPAAVQQPPQAQPHFHSDDANPALDATPSRKKKKSRRERRPSESAISTCGPDTAVASLSPSGKSKKKRRSTRPESARVIELTVASAQSETSAAVTVTVNELEDSTRTASPPKNNGKKRKPTTRRRESARPPAVTAEQVNELISERYNRPSVAPAPSAFSSPRYTPRNKGTRTPAKKPSPTSIQARLDDYPGVLVEHDGLLTCVPCGKVFHTAKPAHLQCHMTSKAHNRSVGRAARMQTFQTEEGKKLKQHLQDNKQAWSTLEPHVLGMRLQLFSIFIDAQIPINKLVHFRDFLEEHTGYAIPTPVNWYPLIGYKSSLHQKDIEDAMSPDSLVHVLFDGTKEHGEEHMIVAARIVSPQFVVEQKVINVGRFEHSFDSGHLFNHLNTVLLQRYRLNTFSILSFGRDGASVNTAAIRFSEDMFPRAVDLVCMSHTLNLAGNHVHHPTLDDFMKKLTAALKVWPMSAMWARCAESRMPTPGETRWWSKYEQLAYILEHRGALDELLLPKTAEDRENLVPGSLHANWNDPELRNDILLELTAVTAGMREIVAATYRFESDAPCWGVFQQIETIRSIKEHNLASMNFRDVQAQITAEINEKFALDVSGVSAYKAERVRKARAVVHSAYDYLINVKLDGELAHQVKLYEVCRLADISYVGGMSPKDDYVEDLLRSRIKPVARFMQGLDVGSMLEALGTYKDLAAEYCRNVSGENITEDNKITWWKITGKSRVPNWAEFALRVLTLLTSTTFVERTLSILSDFSFKQGRMKTDYMEAVMMAKMNYKQREVPEDGMLTTTEDIEP